VLDGETEHPIGFLSSERLGSDLAL